MYLRFWAALLLTLSLAFGAATAAHAYGNVPGTPEDTFHSTGGKGPADGDGGDPDGVGLEQPSQLGAPPGSVELRRDSARATLGSTTQTFRMLRFMLSAFYHLVR
jgi:hypothetical protein